MIDPKLANLILDNLLNKEVPQDSKTIAQILNSTPKKVMDIAKEMELLKPYWIELIESDFDYTGVYRYPDYQQDIILFLNDGGFEKYQEELDAAEAEKVRKDKIYEDHLITTTKQAHFAIKSYWITTVIAIIALLISLATFIYKK